MVHLRGRHPVQYRAVIRFSIFDPAWGGWRATNSGAFASAADYRAYLWSPDRLETRFHLFGELSAPLLQTLAEVHDFSVLVQHSEDLPRPWMERLEGLSRRFPVLRLVPVQGWVEARDTVAADLREHGRKGPVVMLRLDDDDLLARDFLDQLDPHVMPGHHGWCISLGRGVTARYENRALVDFRHSSTPLIAIGQAFVGAYRPRGDHLDLSPLLSHRRVPETLPTVLDSRNLAWVHVRHPLQDTHVGRDPQRTQAAQEKALSRLEPVTELEPLRRAFPSLSPYLVSPQVEPTQGSAPSR